MNDETPYHVVDDSGRHAVTDRGGRTVMVCSDQRSALHYVSLLSQAFRQGYQSGYRDAKNQSKN
ncbi:hypothetical protein NHH03_01645 [Stieleria sp. TO1_6]|uniref:hypothetical protein n=1 Tax=Stieleria tagensis TaxID=2956795 RepID=UPI00209ADF66|nr:hypothetical protein [Stieleria tagensis]MCO8120423.1 hypothetical protein [Stieleria tagensis]